MIMQLGGKFICLLGIVTLCLIPALSSLLAETPEPLPIGKRTSLFYGLNEDPLWNFAPADLSHFSEMLKESGCGSLRIPLRWSVVENKKGVWDFSALDSVMSHIPEHVEILGTLMSVPSWANGTTNKKVTGWSDSYPPRDLSDWSTYVTATVSHYKGRIRYWEIWNEENGVDFYHPHPDAAAYALLLKTAYLAAKRADPGCMVVLGGLQMNGVIPNPWSAVKVSNYLEDLYQAGARDFFDICNIHPYVLTKEGAAHMIDLTRDTRAVMARHGDSEKALWITEVGCGARSSQAEQDQARLLSDTFAFAAKEAGIQRVFWFMLRDMKKDLLGPEGSMGLFSYEGRPKQALDALCRMVPAKASARCLPTAPR